MNLAELRTLANSEIARFNLQGWTFEFNNNKTRLGVCKYTKKRIEICTYFALHNKDSLVLDTLKHELAHAIVGPGHGHRRVWQVKAIELGAVPKACKNDPDVIMKIGDWQSICPNCSHVFHLHRRPKRLDGWNCRKCGKIKGKLPRFRHVSEIPTVIEKPKMWVAVCGGCAKVFEKPFLPPKGVICQKCVRILTFEEK